MKVVAACTCASGVCVMHIKKEVEKKHREQWVWVKT